MITKLLLLAAFATIEVNEEVYRLDLSNVNIETQIINNTLEPSKFIYFGLVMMMVCGISFGSLIQNKLKVWKEDRISPVPLRDNSTIITWLGTLIGLSIVFTSTLEIFDFGSTKSLVISILISLLLGVAMWKVVNDLLIQVEAGTVKEIDEYF